MTLELQKAFKVLPNANHKYCVRHIYDNMRKIHKSLILKKSLEYM